MITYKLNSTGDCVNRIVDGNATNEWHSIKTSKVFHKELSSGAELQDSDGVVMTPEAAQEFIQTLP